MPCCSTARREPPGLLAGSACANVASASADTIRVPICFIAIPAVVRADVVGLYSPKLEMYVIAFANHPSMLLVFNDLLQYPPLAVGHRRIPWFISSSDVSGAPSQMT